jgi:arylsulfatase A
MKINIVAKFRSGSRQDFLPRWNPRLLTAPAAIALFLTLCQPNERAYADGAIDKPNVLFIAVDDLNDWVGCLGGHPQAKTPNIDRLASRGVLFEQAHCAAPLCSPSRTAIMMGLRPSTTGIYGNLNWFRDMPQYKDWVTLPQYFRQHGYLAWGGGKLYHQAHGKFSDAIAWDHVYSTRAGATPPPQSERYKHGLRPKFESNPILARLIDWGPTDHPIEANPDWKTANGAAKFLQQDHDQPFFLGCGIYLPHLPWYAPKKFFDLHPLNDIELPPYKEDDFDDIPAIGKRMGERHIKHIRESGKWKEAVQGCLAADSFADACVGHVLNALEQSRYRDNTIVVLWGDHGYDVGEKKIAKMALWEQTTRTPLIIHVPEKWRNDSWNTSVTTCKRPVSLLDLYPTLLDLCNLPVNENNEGRSIAPLVRNPESNWSYPAVINLRDNHAVRSQQWHYIHYSDGGEELYDTAGDPHQWNNLANDPRFAAAKSQLKEWLPKSKSDPIRREATTKQGETRKKRSAKKRNSTGKFPKNTFTGSTQGKRPNVILLLADDLGSKDIGCDGGPVKTPTLDKLAANGVRFTDFHSGAPVCSTARATLLTGRHHLRTGVYTVIQDHIHDMHLRKSEVTIAEVLKENGYDTAHVGKWHLGTPFRGMDKPWIDEHGFDYWFATDLNAAPSHRNPKNFWRSDFSQTSGLRTRKRVGELKGYACQLVVDEAITWLNEKRNVEKPFFLNVWFHEPHAPLAAPDEIVKQYGELDDPAAIYSATIDNTDRAIARLVKQLDQTGALDNTIIIYTSDHGSYRQERNGNLHAGKGSLMEGGTRTPGIIHWPSGIRGGRVESTPAGAVDLLPTICGLAGIEKPKGVHLDGVDLSLLLQGKSADLKRSQPLTWHSPLSQPIVVIREGKYSLVGWRDKEYPKDKEAIQEALQGMRIILEKRLNRKLTPSELWDKAYNSEIKTPEWNRLRADFVGLNTFQESWIPLIKEGSGGISRFELFDLSTDPGQKRNIANRFPDVTKRLKEQVLEINNSVLTEAHDWSKPVDSDTETMEEKTGIHRLSTTRRSTYDAFSYINRIPDAAYEDETTGDFLGRIFGRLANQEGRVLLKAPAGMDHLGYEGLKTFLSYEGKGSVGNCAACHTLPNFTDGKSHVISRGGTAKPTPSLRNLGKRKVDLRKILLQKIEAAKQKQQGEADDISDAYLEMRLSEQDVPGLVAFLRLLEDGPDNRFRQSIIDAKVLDTSEK